jgi:hypothetical protein
MLQLLGSASQRSAVFSMPPIKRSSQHPSQEDDEGSYFNDGGRAPIRVQTGLNLHGGFMDCAMEIMEGAGFRLICEHL